MSHSELWDAAVEVLRANDLGGWTKPAPRLYPYQWRWDSAFIAIGLVHVDAARGARAGARAVSSPGTSISSVTATRTAKG